MHIAEAADIHQDVEPQGCSRVKSAECLVVPAAMPNAKIDDFCDARGGPGANDVPDRAVGVVARRVEQRCRQFDF